MIRRRKGERAGDRKGRRGGCSRAYLAERASFIMQDLLAYDL